eukprot:12291010-Alexandrium_andersonii.AAC.1
MKRGHALMVEAGEVDPETALRVPVLSYGWLRRWRAHYSITYRTVNLRMKCGKAKLLRRLRAFWRN